MIFGSGMKEMQIRDLESEVMWLKQDTERWREALVKSQLRFEALVDYLGLTYELQSERYEFRKKK
jgi:hypothetical protein